MEKSLLMQKEEFVKGVVALINEGKMPLFITEYALRDILNDVHVLVQQELENETAAAKQAEAKSTEDTVTDVVVE